MGNPEMNESAKLLPEIKKRWLVALRSGLFKQTRNKLQSTYTDAYCCLGVLCELAVADGAIEKERTPANEYEGIDVKFDGQVGLPTIKVYTWATGLDVEMKADWAWAPAVPAPKGKLHMSLNPEGTVSLAQLNDEGRLTFEEIADLIERHL
jgi:hypothetical protein